MLQKNTKLKYLSFDENKKGLIVLFLDIFIFHIR